VVYDGTPDGVRRSSERPLKCTFIGRGTGAHLGRIRRLAKLEAKGSIPRALRAGWSGSLNAVFRGRRQACIYGLV
jgi:hypothetical protein